MSPINESSSGIEAPWIFFFRVGLSGCRLADTTLTALGVEDIAAFPHNATDRQANYRVVLAPQILRQRNISQTKIELGLEQTGCWQCE